MRLRFVLLAFMLTLMIGSTHAQITVTDINNTTPPGLLLVILVDDSSTMNDPDGNLNSIETALGGDVNRRNVSDDNMERWRTVGRLITTLQADTVATHQVAVMSFDNAFRGWYSGNSDNPFIPLGVDGITSTYDVLMNSINNADTGVRPGDTLEAMQVAQDALSDWVNTNGGVSIYKPAIILITDDVPIASWTDSPWNDSNAWLTEMAQPFQAAVTRVSTLVRYSGSYCQHNGGNLIMATIPIGAANWINSDTSINYEGQGDYWQQIAFRNGFVRLDAATALNPLANDPMVYPLDSLMIAPALSGDAIRDTIDRIYSEFRCLYSAEIEADPNQSIGNQISFLPISISPFVEQFQLVFDDPATTIVRITAPDGQEMSTDAVGLRVYQPAGERFRHQVWTFNRDARLASNAAWSGEWTIQTQNSNSNRVQLYYNLDLTGLSWRVLAAPDDESERMRIQLLQNGRPIADNTYIEAVQARLLPLDPDAPPVDDITFRLNEDEYSALLVINNGTYRLAPYITLAQTLKGLGFLAGSRVELPLAPVGADSPVEIRERARTLRLSVSEPDDQLDCADGNFEFNLRMDYGLDPSDLRAQEILYTQMSIEVYHRFTGELPLEATPLAIVPGNLSESAFVASVPCALLDQRAADADPLVISTEQVFEYRPQSNSLVDLPAPVTAVFNYVTPTPTPLPTVTPLPSPTFAIPPPPALDPVREVSEIVTQPPGNLIFGALALLFAFWMLLRGTNRYVRNALPLRRVLIDYRDMDGNWAGAVPLLPRGLGWLPRQRVPIYDEDENLLFELIGSDEQLSGVAHLPLQVGNMRVEQGEAFPIYGEETHISVRDEFIDLHLRIFDYNSSRGRIL